MLESIDMKSKHLKILILIGKPFLWMIPFLLIGDNTLSISFIIYLLTLTAISYVKNPKALLHLSARSYDVSVAEKKSWLRSLVIVLIYVLGCLCLNAAVTILDLTQGLDYNIVAITAALTSYVAFILCCFWDRRWYQRNVSIKVENIDDVLAYMDYWEQERQNNIFVTVAECNDVESAHAIKSKLESKGMEVITFGESSPAYLGNVPVRILVHRKDKEEAEKYING